MNVLVVGGTGTVGGRVVLNLLARRDRPRVLTRSTGRIPSLPTGAMGVIGDTSKPDTLVPAMQGVDAVVLITAMSPGEAHEGVNVVQAARDAGVRRAVFLSVFRAEEGEHLPHFRSKVAIQHALEASGLAWTTVKPNNFFQNDEWLRAPLTAGIYPTPLGGRGLSRIDAGDVADAMVNALCHPGHEGRSYPLAGPQILTGEAVAAAWAAALHRDVRYAGDDLDAWSAAARAVLPGWMVGDLRLMYAFFQEHGLAATPADLEQQATLLGRPPRPFADFAQDIARRWQP